MTELKGPWLLEAEVAFELNISVRQVRAEYREGHLPGIYVDAQVLYPVEFVNSLVPGKSWRRASSAVRDPYRAPLPTLRVRDAPSQQALPAPEPYIRAKEVIQLLSISRQTLSRWVSNGKIPHHRTPGGQLRFKLSEVEQWRRNRELERKGLASPPLTGRRLLEIDQRAREMARHFKEWDKKRDAKREKLRAEKAARKAAEKEQNS